MTNKRIIEEAINIINKYIKGQIPKTRAEISNAKDVRERLNSMMYEKE